MANGLLWHLAIPLTLLENIKDEFIEKTIKPLCEAEMNRFWPEFNETRFRYRKWTGAVLAKIKTSKEFRSAVTYQKDGIIYIIPGKVTNVFDVGREVLSLINKQNIINHGDYQYVKGDVLDEAQSEISEKPDPNMRNTCHLQTYQELRAINGTSQNSLNLFSFWKSLASPRDQDKTTISLDSPPRHELAYSPRKTI